MCRGATCDDSDRVKGGGSRSAEAGGNFQQPGAKKRFGLAKGAEPLKITKLNLRDSYTSEYIKLPIHTLQLAAASP